MPGIVQAQTDREGALRNLAERLEFTVEKTGERFMLTRTADVSRCVREENLSIDQAEELLRTLKLRGLGGG